MKTSRVTAIALATGVTVALALSGCSSNSSVKPATTLNVISLNVSGTPTGDVQAKIIKAFEKSTGAKVNLVENANTLPDAYETSAAGGKEADVAIVNLAEKSTTWVKEGIAIPASKYLVKWGLANKIKPEALDAWKDSKGQVQGFPYNGFVWPVWFNTDLLKRAGISLVPTTTNQLLSDVKKLRAAGVPTMAIGGNDWSGQKLFLQIIQSYMSSSEATKVFAKGGYCASPTAMKGIDLFTKLRDAGLFLDGSQGYTADQMDAAYYGGKASIMAAGSWAFGDATASIQSATKLSGFPIPSGGTFSKPTAYDGYTGSGFWISPNGAKANKIALVKKFILAWYQPKAAAEFAAASNGPTALVTSSSSGQINNKITAQAVADVPKAVTYAVMPDTVVPGTLDTAMIRQTSSAYAPGTSAKSICSSLDSIYTTN